MTQIIDEKYLKTTVSYAEVVMLAWKSIFFFAVNIKCHIWEKDLSGLDHFQKCRRMDLAVSETIYNYVPVM